jgi:hypothetical protein
MHQDFPAHHSESFSPASFNVLEDQLKKVRVGEKVKPYFCRGALALRNSKWEKRRFMFDSSAVGSLLEVSIKIFMAVAVAVTLDQQRLFQENNGFENEAPHLGSYRSSLPLLKVKQARTVHTQKCHGTYPPRMPIYHDPCSSNQILVLYDISMVFICAILQIYEGE